MRSAMSTPALSLAIGGCFWVLLPGVAGSVEAVAVMGQSEGSIAVMMLHSSVSDRTLRDWFWVSRRRLREFCGETKLEYGCLKIRRDGSLLLKQAVGDENKVG